MRNSQAELQVVFEVNTNIRASCNRHKGGAQLPLVDPDLDILAIEEHVQAAGMIQVQVSQDDLLDVFQLVTRGLDRRLQLMLRLISDACEDVRDRRPPHFRVVLPAARLPQDQALVRVLHQDAVHGQLATLVDERLVFGAHETRVASADDERLVTFEPADLEEMELGAFGAHVRDVAWHGAPIELSLDSGHV